MAPYDVIGPAILDFTFFLRCEEITEINAKSSQNAHEMRKSVKLYNTELCKKVDIWPYLYAMCCCHGNTKSVRHTIDI